MCGKVFLDSFRRAQIGGKIRVDYEKGKKMVKYYMQVILHVYLFLLMVILPYYMPEGYVKLGLYKYTFFREVGVQCLFMMLPAVLMLFVRQWKNLAWSHLSVTDKAMFFYAVAVMLSYICTEWKEQAVWGRKGGSWV